jgi:D-sedoheptulose 7-phosphate isomerase
LNAELVGAYKMRDRPGLYSVALTVDTSILTAVGNDYGYDKIFARQVEAIGKPGDILFGISTSGGSKNIIEAFEMADSMGITTIAFTGKKSSKMADIAHIDLKVPSEITNNIQEMHIKCGHTICGVIEHHFFGPKVK